MTLYTLPGDKNYQERIYPNPSDLNPDKPQLRLNTYQDVIGHFTASSLAEDGIQIKAGSLQVTASDQGYTVGFEPLAAFDTQAEQFAAMHVAMLSEHHAGLALQGIDACKLTPAWNPMAGYPVNKIDGLSQWVPCLPLGMPMVNHRAVTLLHYPPIAAYRTANYLQNATLRRWAQLLVCAGVDQPQCYHAILDVNPIAAPGSGESEYPNDYFPINLTAMFFDNEKLGHTYLRAMIELMLNPPANAANPTTLPLLVCGSPSYDPQAPGWFRTRYKDQLPKDQYGTPSTEMLQVGFVKITPRSRKKTPYMIANHMIAAGVQGKFGGDPSQIPNIQKFEAQDLVAATFLYLCDEATKQGKEIDPDAAKEAACQRWFGAPNGEGAPNPPAPADMLTICALAQMDKCNKGRIPPTFTFEECVTRCKLKGGPDYSPCFGCTPIPDMA